MHRTVGLSPFKAKTYDWAEVLRVCQTSTIQGFSAMLNAGVGDQQQKQTPFRFVYMSGMGAEPDQSKKPFFSPQYLLMRVSQSARDLFWFPSSLCPLSPSRCIAMLDDQARLSSYANDMSIAGRDRESSARLGCQTP